MLGAGATFFSFEAAYRADSATESVLVHTASRYGLATILLRASQTGMLVFWVSLMACAEKGLALYAVVASLIVYFCMMFEAAGRGAAPSTAAFPVSPPMPARGENGRGGGAA